MTRPDPHPLLKLALDLGPLAVFFAAFQYGAKLAAIPEVATGLGAVIGAEALAGPSAPLLVATVVFMAAIAVSLALSWALTRTLPRMAVVTAVVVAVFGGLTLYLHDESFIKMKPTIVNGIFALILTVGLLQGRSYLKYLMGSALPLTDTGWMIFTRRWTYFFVFLAVLNELVWRTQSTEFWVGFKTFGNLPLTILFMACQWPMLRRHEATDQVTER